MDAGMFFCRGLNAVRAYWKTCFTNRDASAKLPAQRQLASVVWHEEWLAVVGEARAADADAAAHGTQTRADREATRMIGVSQPWAAGWLAMRPTLPCPSTESVTTTCGLRRQ